MQYKIVQILGKKEQSHEQKTQMAPLYLRHFMNNVHSCRHIIHVFFFTKNTSTFTGISV